MLRRLAISCALVCSVLPAHARTRPRYGDTLRVEVAGDPWQEPDGLARRLVLEGLTAVATDGDIRPALALTWNAENGDRRWQFRLRPAVRFHDGSPVTPAAIVSSLTAACAADCPWVSIRALSTSVVFTSESPIPQLPALLAGDEFLISRPGATPDGGTGPFQISGFSNGILTLSANDASWQGRPFVDAIQVRAHRAIADQWTDLAAGRADLVEVPAEQIRQARQQHFTLLISPPVDVLALQLPASGALAAPALRSAIAHAIDRNALANVIFQRQGISTAALVPQQVSGFAFLFPAERDLNKARQLRGDAPALRVEADGDGAYQVAAQRIALNLREAGFGAQPPRTGAPPVSLRVRRLRVESADAAADLSELARDAGEAMPQVHSDPAAAYRAEREFLDRNTLIPLLDLPRAFAVGSRVSGLHLLFDGTPDLANASVEPAR